MEKQNGCRVCDTGREISGAGEEYLKGGQQKPHLFARRAETSGVYRVVLIFFTGWQVKLFRLFWNKNKNHTSYSKTIKGLLPVQYMPMII